MKMPKLKDEEDLDIEDELDGLYTESTTSVYPGSKMSVVSATIIIMNMCSMFCVSNTFTDELSRFLSGDLLPVPNKLPKIHYAARKFELEEHPCMPHWVYSI
jgi:hypothetical protein